MKYTILLIAIVLLAGASCKKADRNYTHCYVCNRWDSTVSTIPPHVTVSLFTTDTLCGQTDITIEYYMKTHADQIDTLVNIHDTVIVRHWRSADCEVP